MILRTPYVPDYAPERPLWLTILLVIVLVALTLPMTLWLMEGFRIAEVNGWWWPERFLIVGLYGVGISAQGYFMWRRQLVRFFDWLGSFR